MPSFNGEVWAYGYVYLCMKPMAYPSCPHFGYTLNFRDVARSVLDLTDHL
jgi:hypothetical protein